MPLPVAPRVLLNSRNSQHTEHSSLCFQSPSCPSGRMLLLHLSSLLINAFGQWLSFTRDLHSTYHIGAWTCLKLLDATAVLGLNSQSPLVSLWMMYFYSAHLSSAWALFNPYPYSSSHTCGGCAKAALLPTLTNQDHLLSSLTSLSFLCLSHFPPRLKRRVGGSVSSPLEFVA